MVVVLLLPAQYLYEGLLVRVQRYEGNPMSFSLPKSVVLEVADCPPGIKGASEKDGGKVAITSTGLKVKVPRSHASPPLPPPPRTPSPRPCIALPSALPIALAHFDACRPLVQSGDAGNLAARVRLLRRGVMVSDV
jgi:hypothetical protein